MIESLSADQLSQIDIFQDVKAKTLEQFPGTVSKRTFAPDELICREGEGGTTAF